MQRLLMLKDFRVLVYIVAERATGVDAVQILQQYQRLHPWGRWHEREAIVKSRVLVVKRLAMPGPGVFGGAWNRYETCSPVLSTCPLHTNSGCGKERRILFGPW